MKSASSTSASFDSPAQLLKHFERNARFEYGISTLLGLIQVGFTIAFAWQVAMMLDLAIYQTNTPTQLPDSTDWLILVFVLAGRSTASAIQSRMGNQASIKVRSALRSFALKHCFELNIRLFPAFTATEASNLLVTEIDRQLGYFADFIAQKNLSVLMPLAIIIASATVSWLVPLIFLFTAPLVPLFMILVGSRAAEISRVNLTELNRLGDLLTDRLKNLQALQLTGTTEAEGDRLFDQSERYRTSTMKVLRLSFLSGTLLEFFSAISVAIVAVYLGLFFLNKYDFGSYSSGYGLFEGVFLLILAPEFYLPLRRLGALYHDKMDASSMAEHLLKLDHLYQQECSSPSSSGENEGSDKSSPTSQISQQPLKQLTIDQLQSGSSGTPVHSPVSFSLHPGQRLLLNGPSGVGKTTLLDTLAGLRQPASGSISVNGKPIELFHQSGWFRQIGYLSQRPELFFASVRENLELGIAFSDEALFSALEKARAADLVHSLPDGLDYQISDDGGYLSGGQAQRIALARVFLHRPALLLLDEPTANLDEATAQEFMQRLLHYTDQGGMLIMASHRPGERVVFHQQIDMHRAPAAENANPGANPSTNKPTGDAQ